MVDDPCASAPPASENAPAHLDSGDTSIPQRPQNPLPPDQPGSVEDLIRHLHERFPGVPLSALGQTILWDEPMKAVLLPALKTLAPGTPFRLSVMDTDYFAKPPLETDGPGEYVLLPHNDTLTKDLWVATGELSRIFGCETVPTREMFREHGVQLERVARASGENRLRFLDRVTEAWGWKGLAFTGSRRTLAGEIPLSGALPRLLEELEWGFSETAAAWDEPEAREQAHAAAGEWIETVKAYAEAHPDASITDLYQHLAPRFTASLLGCRPEEQGDLEVSGSLADFRFNRETAGNPRFELLDLFLRPETAEKAKTAYNDAVRGSDIYTLDRFSQGAIPFDLVIPGRGRGTIRLIPERVIVEMEERVYIRIDRPIENVNDLAKAVERGLGTRVSLVGKALTLIAMLARCGLVVLNETGSTYVWRTRNMMEGLCDQGIRFGLYPIVRLRYPTWESLGVTGKTLRLPDHLSWAFGAPTLPAQEYSARWLEVSRRMRQILADAARSIGPRETVEFLARYGGPEWAERGEAFEAGRELLMSLRTRLDEIRREIQCLLAEIKDQKAEGEALSRARGEDYRQRVHPLRESLWEQGVKSLQPATLGMEGYGVRPLTGEPVKVEDPAAVSELLLQIGEETERRRREFEAPWEALRTSIHDREHRLRELDRERAALLREERVLEARRRSEELYSEAQSAKLAVVRNAYLVVEGLEHTQYRPAAWWMLLLDPQGDWFGEIRAHTQAYLEPLSCCAPPCE